MVCSENDTEVTPPHILLLLWLDNINEVRGKITISYFPGERIITDHIIVLDNREITAHFWHIYKEVESHRFTPNSRGKFSDKRSIDVMRVSLVLSIVFFVDCWCLNAFSWPVSSLLWLVTKSSSHNLQNCVTSQKPVSSLS